MEPTADPQRRPRWQTYLLALIITATIFGTALAASAYFDSRRLAEVRATQDNISIDILSLETQFDLLAENSCKDIRENSVLSREIGTLGARVTYMENQTGIDQAELDRLKRYYSLLQIKDLLLMKEVSDKCGLDPVFILYFYSNKGDCPDCEQQGYALTALSQQYPQLRIYSFDYNLDLTALRTLIQINDVPAAFPALVIEDTVYTGFQSIAAIEEIVPELESLRATSTDGTPAAEQN